MSGGAKGAIVFDLDGTLIDSAADIGQAASRVLATEGAAPLSLAETRSFIGNGARVLMARAMAARGLPEHELPRLHQAFVAIYESAHGTTQAYCGVAPALADLAAKGHPLGICTNKPAAPARAVLAHLGLAHLFGVVIGGDSLSVTKPDPAPLHAAFAALGVPLLYVGDSEVDRDTALAAGIRFALFTEGYRKAPISDFGDALLFSDFAALPDLVKRLSDEADLTH